MNLLRIHASPGRSAAFILSWFLFAAGVTTYFYLAQQRHRDNPDDRIMPTAAQMIGSFQDAALKPADEEEVQDDSSSTPPLAARIRASMLWKDTTATGRRFLISV